MLKREWEGCLARAISDFTHTVGSWQNPIVLRDADGKEPVKSQAGTAAEFKALISGPQSNSKPGLMISDAAQSRLIAWGQTSGFIPEDTWLNTKSPRYVYTKKGGWIDMQHFMFYAGQALEHKANGAGDPVGEAMETGFHQENLLDPMIAPWSAQSYEDLPSDRYGALFGATVFDPKSKKTLGEQIEAYLNSLGATSPSSAPNWSNVPANDQVARRNWENAPRTGHGRNIRRRQVNRNDTTTPMYTTE